MNMSLKDYKDKKELVEVSEAIINDRVNLIEGTDRLVQLIDINNEEYKFLLPIIGIWSQATDIVAEKYPDETHEPIELHKYKDELKSYFAKEGFLIFDLCEEIIKKYTHQISIMEQHFNSSFEQIFKDVDPITIYFPDLRGKYIYRDDVESVRDKLINTESREKVEDILSEHFIERYGDFRESDKQMFESLTSKIWTTLAQPL
jgi:hypothetical protein